MRSARGGRRHRGEPRAAANPRGGKVQAPRALIGVVTKETRGVRPTRLGRAEPTLSKLADLSKPSPDLK